MRFVILGIVVACSSPPPEPVCETRPCVFVELAKAQPDRDRYAATVYGPVGAELLRKLRAHPGFDALIVDPGSMLRIDELLAFVAKQHLDDPWIARARFSESLGKRRVYRGMRLPTDVFETIKREGMLSGERRESTPPVPTSFIDMMSNHLSGRTSGSLISVSDDITVSRCVARIWGRAGSSPIYVFTLDVPVLDLIVVTPGANLCGPDPAPASVDCKRPTAPLDAAQRAYACHRFHEAAVESFVLHRIDPSEVVAIETPTDFTECNKPYVKPTEPTRQERAAQLYCKPGTIPD
ncbi:MAG: hypothetical protein ABI867_23510 [Kofleriaceae bacterium]